MKPSKGYPTVTMPRDHMQDLVQILSREIEGHHNRAENYLLGEDVEEDVAAAKRCMAEAHHVRMLRKMLNNALRIDAELPVVDV